MTVKELIKQLQTIENKNLEVFVEQGDNKDNKAQGVYIVFTPTKKEKLPKDCVVVES